MVVHLDLMIPAIFFPPKTWLSTHLFRRLLTFIFNRFSSLEVGSILSMARQNVFFVMQDLLLGIARYIC